MRQHLLRLGILVLGGCVGAIFGAYQTHKVESGRIAALQGELDRAKGKLDQLPSGELVAALLQSELDRNRREAVSQLHALYSVPEPYQHLVAERLQEAYLRARYGDEKGKVLYEADKAESGLLHHRDRR